MRTARMVSLGLLILCAVGLILCVVWAQSQPPTLTVISQVPIEEERVDVLVYTFMEYDITLADDSRTLYITPFSYRVLDSFNDVMRISTTIGAQPIAVFDTVQAANAFVMRLRVLLLLACLAVEIILGRYLWCYARQTIRKVYKGLMQYYPHELIKQEGKTLTSRSILLLTGLAVMAALWSLSVFEPVWSSHSTGSFLNNIWMAAFPPLAADSVLEKVSLAATILLASGIALTAVAFILCFNGSMYYKDINIDD